MISCHTQSPHPLPWLCFRDFQAVRVRGVVPVKVKVKVKSKVLSMISGIVVVSIKVILGVTVCPFVKGLP